MSMLDLLVILAWLVIILAIKLTFSTVVLLILIVLSLIIVRAIAGERPIWRRSAP